MQFCQFYDATDGNAIYKLCVLVLNFPPICIQIAINLRVADLFVCDHFSSISPTTVVGGYFSYGATIVEFIYRQFYLFYGGN